MKYSLVYAVSEHVQTDKGKVGTPIVGYVLKNNENEEKFFVKRKDAFNLVQKHGAVNVEAFSRTASCKEDVLDEQGLVYYLKPTDGKKINQYLISYDEFLELGLI